MEGDYPPITPSHKIRHCYLHRICVYNLIGAQSCCIPKISREEKTPKSTRWKRVRVVLGQTDRFRAEDTTEESWGRYNKLLGLWFVFLQKLTPSYAMAVRCTPGTGRVTRYNLRLRVIEKIQINCVSVTSRSIQPHARVPIVYNPDAAPFAFKGYRAGNTIAPQTFDAGPTEWNN